MLIAKHVMALPQPASPAIPAGLWSEPTAIQPALILSTAQWLHQESHIVTLHVQANTLIGMQAVGRLVTTRILGITIQQFTQKSKALIQNACFHAEAANF